MTAARLAPLLFFGVVVLVFSGLSERFWAWQNALNILLQAAPLAVMAVGMGLVMLVGGIDLSVGAVMYLVGGVIALHTPQATTAQGMLVALLVGLACGALNGLFVVGLRMVAFVATMALMFVERGLGLYLTNTQGVAPGPGIAELARSHWLGVPAALWLAGLAVAAAALMLHTTPLGRWVCAIGAHRDGARRAGIAVAGVTFTLYVLGGLYAALGGFITLFQVGFVSSAFGEGSEFLAVAAAALGGVSLFGGRGGVGGPVLGALLIQTVQNGLVMAGADPYVYPLVTALCIFAAVSVDSLRLRAAEGGAKRPRPLARGDAPC